MIAPGVAYFFFTIEEKPIIYSEYKVVKSKQSFNLTYDSENYFLVQLLSMNIFETEYNQNLIFNPKSYYPLVTVKPRQQTQQINYEKELSSPSLDYFENLDFVDINEYSQETIEKCYQYDLKFINLQSFIKEGEELEQLEEKIQEYYKQLIHLYRYLTAQQFHGNTFFLSLQTLKHFFKHIRQISKNNSIINIEATYQQILSNDELLKETQKQKSQQQLHFQRYQFIELIVKLSIEFSQKPANESLQDFFEQLILPNMILFEEIDWTIDAFKQPQILKVQNNYGNILIELFEFYSIEKEEKKNNKKFISLSQFKNLLYNAQLIDSNFTENDANCAFIFSSSLKIIEKNNKILLNQQQFIRACLRVASKLLISPVGFTSSQSTPKKILQFPFYINYESLLITFQKQILNYNSEESNEKKLAKIPQVSLFSEELLDIIQQYSPKKFALRLKKATFTQFSKQFSSKQQIKELMEFME